MESRCELNLNPDNPTPFVQPFLVLNFDRQVRSPLGDRPNWVIDVSGQIDRYIKDYLKLTSHFYSLIRTLKPEDQEKSNLPKMINSCVNWRSQATPLLESVIEGLGGHSLTVDSVDGYTGSAGPTHLLRNGAFFERISLDQIRHTSSGGRNLPDIADFLPAILKTLDSPLSPGFE